MTGAQQRALERLRKRGTVQEHDMKAGVIRITFTPRGGEPVEQLVTQTGLVESVPDDALPEPALHAAARAVIDEYKDIKAPISAVAALARLAAVLGIPLEDV